MSRVVIPRKLTIISTNVPGPIADGYSAYNAATTYALSDEVFAEAADGLDHIYRSALDGNVGNPITDETKWVDIGPCNRDAMFDDRTGTTTTHDDDIIVTVQADGAFDTIALINVTGATSVSATIAPAGGTPREVTGTLLEDASSWLSYFTDDLNVRGTKAIWNVGLSFSSATIEIRINGSAPSVGMALIGGTTELGLTEYGATVGIEDYSTKETDEWGNTYLRERDYADTADVKIVCELQQVDALRRIFAGLRARPALYDMNNPGTSFESLVVFGKYDNFSLDMAYHNQAYCTLRIIGLV